MKKALKIFGIILLIFVALLMVIPFAFQSQIQDMVKRFINDNLNAKVEFSDVSLSFIRSFPQAHVSVSDLLITNFEPFKDETFLSSKNVVFTMSIKELFKNTEKEPITINSIAINEALLTLKTDKFGNDNYDITKDEENISTESKTNGFSFDIEHYSINNSALTYIDEASKTLVYITELNHTGKGVFSADKSELDTKSEAHMTFAMDSINYLNNNPIKLDAVIGMDLNNSKYTFKENKGFINKLPLEFNGYVQLLENGQEVDITFENPESSFKNFLAVMPEVYSKNIENVETTGNFKVKGLIKGLVSEETIPNLDINITSNNASFKYPDLPKRVENISIHTAIKNTTGKTDDTYVDIKTLDFKIDNDTFKSSAVLKNITGNMLVNAAIDGTINLGNISKAYPFDIEKELSGILKAKLNTAFDMNAIETNAYERIKNNGSISLKDVVFSSESLANPVNISKADVSFNSENIALNSFNAKTGGSDFNLTGSIKNLLGFLLSDAKLQGNFNANSNTFKVSDFMTEEVATSTEKKPNTDTSSLKIPAFLDCTINAEANTVVYDNLSLKNVKGKLIIKDEQAVLENMSSDIFDGQLAISGLVSTKSSKPIFDMDLGVKSFDIAKSFNGLELFQSLAPIAKVLQGKLNTSLNLKGSLGEDFSLDLNSISGNAFAELLANTISSKDNPLLNKLGGALSFIEFDKLNLNDLKANLVFDDGKVSVKPFNVTYNDISIQISGSHSFDKKLDYNAVFNVPAKYLGSDVNRLIGKIDDSNINNISIPVTANIAGTYSNPSLQTDLTTGVASLTKQLVEVEKQKLLNQGKDKANSMLGGLLGGSSKPIETDSTATTKADTTKTNTNTVEKEIKNVLGGLIKNRKKKDTIN